MIEVHIQGKSRKEDLDLFKHLGTAMASRRARELAGMEITGKDGDIWFHLPEENTVAFACLRVFKNGKGHIRFAVALSVKVQVELVDKILEFAKDLELDQLYTYAIDREVWLKVGFKLIKDKRHGKYVRWEIN